MPTGNLSQAIAAAIERAVSQAHEGPLAQQGVVEESKSNSHLIVLAGGRHGLGVLATEEPIKTGDAVWTVRAADGVTVILGAVR